MITTTLAYFPSPSQGVWHVGPIPIRAYALCILAGIVVALLIGDRRWQARGGERGVIYDIALWAVPFGLLGGRLYHVITDWKTYFGPGGAGLGAALSIWEGGLGIWGAVALGAVGAWIGCRRHGIPLPAFGDAIAPGIVLAQGIGRVGNYFNQELYGRETTVPWGMEIFYRRDPSNIVSVDSLNGVSTGQVAAVVHPTFLYELLWNVLVFVALLYIDRRFKIGHGRLFALYVAGYCVGRFCVELLRSDFATHIAGVRINSFTATFVFIGAVVYFILAPKGREDPATLRGRWAEAEDEEVEAPELVKDLAAVAATSGVVAAATVASREDEDSGSSVDTSELDESASEDVAPGSELDEWSDLPLDADDVEESEDESILEAEVAGAGVETETLVEAEDADLIDEDHDPVDEDDLESLSDEVAVVAGAGPVSEQQEELAEGDEAEPDAEEPTETEPEDVAPEAVVDGSDVPESDVGEPAADAVAADEPDADVADETEPVESDAEAEAEVTPEAETEPEAEPVESDAEAEAEVTPEAETEPEDVAPEAVGDGSDVPEPEVEEPAADAVAADEPDADVRDETEPVESDAEAEAETEPEPEPATPESRGSRWSRVFRRRRG